MFVSKVLARAAGLTALASVLVLLAPGSAFSSDQSRPCRSQFERTRLTDRLVRMSERLVKGQPVTIVALGSSSTGGAGASSPAASYPSRLAARLAETLPGHSIRVLNRGVNGEDVKEMMTRFDQSVGAEKPDLVLWQTGTNALLRGVSLDEVRSLVAEGVARMKALGADVILIDPQFAPAVIDKPQAHAMVSLMADMAKEGHADIFPRFAVMQHWHEGENIPVAEFVAPDGLHMNDWSYACFARLLGDSITEAATRPSTLAVAPLGRPRP